MGAMFSHCGDDKKTSSTDPCTDLSDIGENDLKARKKFNYVDESPDKNKTCDQCKLYLPSEDLSCGQCMLFKGPVKAGGSCTYWAPKI